MEQFPVRAFAVAGPESPVWPRRLAMGFEAHRAEALRSSSHGTADEPKAAVAVIEPQWTRGDARTEVDGEDLVPARDELTSRGSNPLKVRREPQPVRRELQPSAEAALPHEPPHIPGHVRDEFGIMRLDPDASLLAGHATMLAQADRTQPRD